MCRVTLMCLMLPNNSSMRRSFSAQSRRGRNSRLMNWGNIETKAVPISIFGEEVKKNSDDKKSYKIKSVLKDLEAFKVNHKMQMNRISKNFENKVGILSLDKVSSKLKKLTSVTQNKDITEKGKTFLLRDGSDIVMDINNLPEEKESNIRKVSAKTDDALEDGDNTVDDTSDDDDDTVCVKKVMQISETVYEDRIVCHHTVSEKCHHTFLTDYVPTLEKHCQNSYHKKCSIIYKPEVHSETVSVCNEPLQKHCSNTTVGEVICSTYYETRCQTRYKEHQVEEDKPVCKIVTERKCKNVQSIGASGHAKQQEFTLGMGETGANYQECTDWPVKKCTLEKTVVTKSNPETSCRKISRNICAPSNCVVKKGEKICRDETQNTVSNTPTESCYLEPQEDCKMETVLVPRLVQKPRCVKVPREVCVNTRGNPRKILKPIVKEWCYSRSELKLNTRKGSFPYYFRKHNTVSRI